MKSISLFLFALSLSLPAFADGNPPPAELKRDTFAAWIKSVGGVVSAFNDEAFDWYETQLRSEIPATVAQDPDHLVVAVDKALQQTIAHEDAGDVEVGTTLGFEAYEIIDANIDTALQTLLFGWGKPIGQPEGTTYPVDTVFSFRQESMKIQWGVDNYQTNTNKTGGGLAKELHDDCIFLVRGDAQTGYMAVGNFLKAAGNSATTSHISIAYFKPMADGRTEFRVTVRQTGQNYTFLGIEYGRKNFGFNTARIRLGQKNFMNSIQSLKNTGKIPEKRPR